MVFKSVFMGGGVGVVEIVVAYFVGAAGGGVDECGSALVCQ